MNYYRICFLPTILVVLSWIHAPDVQASGQAVSPTPGSVLHGKVVKIADGDTLTILVDGHDQVKIRLAEIDTPERGQPYGRKAQDELSALVWKKDVRVRVVDTDRYGRTVGRVYVGDVDVCAQMVSRGAAWVYRKYATDDTLYDREQEARDAGRGIWGLSETQRVAPWEWRRNKRTGSP